MVRVSKVTRTSIRLSHSPAKLETAENHVRPVTRAEKQRASTLVEFGNAVLKLEATTSQPSLRSTHHGYNLRSTLKRTSEVSPQGSTNSVRRPQGLTTASGARPRTGTVPDTSKITPAPRATRQRKRPPSPSVLDERPTKGRPGRDEVPTKRTGVLRRELLTMRDEASTIHDLIAQTEEAVNRTTARVKELREETKMLCIAPAALPLTKPAPEGDRTRGLPAQEGECRQPRTAQPAPTDKNPVPPVTSLATAWVRPSDPNRDPYDYSKGELASLYHQLLDASPTLCTCRRTALQQTRVDKTKCSRPRPRFGVDAQGMSFQDWAVCATTRRRSHSQRRMIKEIIISQELLLEWERLDDDHRLLLPALLRPRRPRGFTTQFTLQFRHLPRHVFDTLELWHISTGRCLNCIVVAMRTFPPWIVETRGPEETEDGNPVYVNLKRNELIEWDDDRKSWRHLVLDHHTWIPIQELEERSGDSAADPSVINGSFNKPIPQPFPLWYGTILDTPLANV